MARLKSYWQGLQPIGAFGLPPIGALDRGYDLTLIKDAHTTESIELEDGTKVEAANIYILS